MKQSPAKRIALLLKQGDWMKPEDRRWLTELYAALELDPMRGINWLQSVRIKRIKAYLDNPKEPTPCGAPIVKRYKDEQGDWQEFVAPHTCERFSCPQCHSGVVQREMKKAREAFESISLDPEHLSYVTLFADAVRAPKSAALHRDARSIRRLLNNLQGRALRGCQQWGYLPQACFKPLPSQWDGKGVLVHYHGWIVHPHLTSDQLRAKLKKSFPSLNAAHVESPRAGGLMGNVLRALGYACRQGWTDKGIGSKDGLVLLNSYRQMGPNLRAYRISGGFPKVTSEETTDVQPDASACGVTRVETPSPTITAPSNVMLDTLRQRASASRVRSQVSRKTSVYYSTSKQEKGDDRFPPSRIHPPARASNDPGVPLVERGQTEILLRSSTR